jgi:preprotein translocase subunit SecD
LQYIDNAKLDRFWSRDRASADGYRRLYRLYPGNSERGKNATKDQKPDMLYLIDMSDRMFVSGRDIVQANMEYGGTTGASPHVSFSFNSEGGKRFGDLTSANVNRALAIILDDKVISAPNIKSAITEGSGVIEGSFTTTEASTLATTLRLGALPARLTLEQEAVVGSTLGADSVRNGIMSALIGLAVAMAFLFVYYRMSGLLANSAILLNMLITASILVLFRATLSLPGIAGYILSIGMSVDANVLIYERIREELRLGKTIRASVDAGFKRAFVTILDSNATTMVGGIVLYIAGNWTSSLYTLKSFAITLIIGILASFFTAIVFTRAVFEFFLNRRIHKLSI